MSSLPQLMINPFDIRTRIRRQRQSLSPSQRAHAADAACRQFQSALHFQTVTRIAFYLAVNGELDPEPLMRQALAMGKQCYLPVLHPLSHNRLWFASWQPGDALRSNRYGILEPVWTPSSLIRPWALDMVVAPLVAFDQRGNRMGMGGGYYDRTFAFRKHRRYWNKPLLVGYGYEMQKIARVAVRSWDIVMDAVVTETALYMG